LSFGGENKMLIIASVFIWYWRCFYFL